jgi:betaine-homocysteine S-methyltransferase
VTTTADATTAGPRAGQGLLERLAAGPVLCAEGYVFELERRGYVSAGAYVPEAVLDHPEAVAQLHDELVRAGSDVVVALTYYAHRDKLRVVGREEDGEALNRQALRLASRAARSSGALLAGNICNTWLYRPGDPEAAAAVRAQYTEQVALAAEAGVDFVLAETLEYVGEALIALDVIRSFGLPAVVSFTPIYEESKDGHDWVDACRLLERAGADVVGFNCARGPETLLPLGRRLRAAVDVPISLVPVPYRTTARQPSFQFLTREDGTSAYTTGLDGHLLDRISVASFAEQARDLGADLIGLCCGVGPHHVRAVAEALGRPAAASRYSPDFTRHGLLGDDTVVRAHERAHLRSWR